MEMLLMRTFKDNKPIWINPRFVQTVSEGNDGSTKIVMLGGEEGFLAESPIDVVNELEMV